MTQPIAARDKQESIPREKGWKAPFISVIVPIRNEAAYIETTLNQLLDQHYDSDRFEILVADGLSDDDTIAVVKRMAQTAPQVRLLSNPKRLSSAGRNLGVKASRGDLLVVIDGHCDLANPHYLRLLADAFERSGADCIGRPQPLDISSATTLQRAIAAARSSRLGHNPASYIYSTSEGFVHPQSVGVAYRRNVFERIGLFDEQFDACEDVEFNHRLFKAGLTCYFTPQVKVAYHPRNTLIGLFRQMVRYGRGRIRLFRKHRDSLSLAVLVPALFVVSLTCGAIVAALFPWIAFIYLLGVIAYGSAILGASVLLALRKNDMQIMPWLPLVFGTIHAGAGFGVIREFLGGRRVVAGAEALYEVRSLRVVMPEDSEDNASGVRDRRAAMAVPSHPLAKGA